VDADPDLVTTRDIGPAVTLKAAAAEPLVAQHQQDGRNAQAEAGSRKLVPADICSFFSPHVSMQVEHY
jgi:hypothetical protein